MRGQADHLKMMSWSTGLFSCCCVLNRTLYHWFPSRQKPSSVIMLLFYFFISSAQNSSFFNHSDCAAIFVWKFSFNCSPLNCLCSPLLLFSCSCCGQKRWRCWCVEVQNLIWALCSTALSTKVTVKRTPPFGKIHLVLVHQHQLTCPQPSNLRLLHTQKLCRMKSSELQGWGLLLQGVGFVFQMYEINWT